MTRRTILASLAAAATAAMAGVRLPRTVAVPPIGTPLPLAFQGAVNAGASKAPSLGTYTLRMVRYWQVSPGVFEAVWSWKALS